MQIMVLQNELQLGMFETYHAVFGPKMPVNMGISGQLAELSTMEVLCLVHPVYGGRVTVTLTGYPLNDGLACSVTETVLATDDELEEDALKKINALLKEQQKPFRLVGHGAEVGEAFFASAPKADADKSPLQKRMESGGA